MKSLFTLIFSIFLIGFSFGQNQNKERINELDGLIQQAVDKGDYDKAAILKEEKTIRLDIDKAIAENDFEKAELLKAKLKKLGSNNDESKQEATTVETNSNDKKEENVETVPQKSEKESSGKPAINSKNIYFYMDFGIGAATLDTYYTKYLISTATASSARLAIDLKIGTKFFFNSNESKMRIGLDMNWLSLNPQLGGYVAPAVNISLVKPGFAFAYSFNEKMGVDAAFNLGTNLFFHPDESIFAAGLNLNPHFKFQISKFCVGFEYQAQLHLTDSFKTNMFALTAGLKL